ncbi:hypothetical protein BJP36_10495 [Moorena producens JHB]|uniref:Uncharacterized protein n=1 Tax=Moorena producens (strain JHB) TaxID=1454205 RepID=A0A1D9FY29_MOOP1|nr:hypothetical protein [Moorena producens]AOY80286.1 hypothetical protein BJP36_10495 [Moorena producens JHB]
MKSTEFKHQVKQNIAFLIAMRYTGFFPSSHFRLASYLLPATCSLKPNNLNFIQIKIARNNMPNSVQVVMGVPGVGKSTYIKSMITRKIWKDSTIIQMKDEYLDLDKMSIDGKNKNYIVHYSLLIEHFFNLKRDINNGSKFDFSLIHLLRRAEQLNTYFLVAPYSEIKKRVLLRDNIEPLTGQKIDNNVKHKLLATLGSINLPKVYSKYFDLWEKRKIKYTIVNTTNYSYELVSTKQEAIQIIK